MLVTAVETIFGLAADEFCGSGKEARSVMAKEVFILIGKDAGASLTQLSVIVGLDTSTVSRRYESAIQNSKKNSKMAYACHLVKSHYDASIAELQD